MPERELDIDATSVLVEWGPLRLIGPGRLRLTSDALEVNSTGGVMRAGYQELRGGGWRTGYLEVHGEQGRAVVESAQQLELVWVLLLERACPLPELARDHRHLGSRRGGRVDAQSRFLAPLLEARKRVEQERDLDARVELLDAKKLRERVQSALRAIAHDAFPASLPDRRALEAELEEALTSFFSGLDHLAAAASRFRSAPEAIRFLAWRDWVHHLSVVFTLADSGWAAATRFLPAQVKP